MTTETLTEASTARDVQTKEWKLHYNEAGSGHPIIMTHGTGPGATGWSNFNPNLGPLSKKFRVILLDQPGWGGSDPHDPSKEPRPVTNARAIKLLMDELGLEKAALIGNSMGGGATLQFAIDYPERMSHLITMGSGAPGVNIIQPLGPLEGIRIIRETYMNPTPENFKRLVSIMVYDDSFVGEELIQQRSKAALANQTHLDNWLKPGVMVPLDMAKLTQTKAPSLIFHGRDDRVVPLEGSLRLVSAIPDSRLVVFNHCGHWAQVEHAADFNWMVEEFITRHG